MERIPTTENGLEATRKRENELHPTDAKGKTFIWWDKRSHVFQLLVGNTNALIDADAEKQAEIAALTNRVAILENAPQVPFPAFGLPMAGE